MENYQVYLESLQTNQSDLTKSDMYAPNRYILHMYWIKFGTLGLAESLANFLIDFQKRIY